MSWTGMHCTKMRWTKMGWRDVSRRKTVKLVQILVSALVLAICSTQGAPAQVTCNDLTVTGDGSLFSDGFEVGSTERWGVAPPPFPRFHATDTLEIRFELGLAPETTGEHRVDFRVLLPEGNLYQSIAVPVDASSTLAAATRGRRRLVGYPDPVPVQAPRARSSAVAPSSVDGLPRAEISTFDDETFDSLVAAPAEIEGAEAAAGDLPVTARMPVGGTLITTGSLYGDWSVAVHVDGAETPCATTGFTIRP